MSDTPRTDAEYARLKAIYDSYPRERMCCAFENDMTLARQLERELNQAIKERDRFKECDESVGALHRLMSDAGIECGHIVDRVERVVIQRDENKAGWDNARITALDLEQRLKRAEKCISAIEAHYKAKHGESYNHTTLHTIIENWRNK